MKHYYLFLTPICLVILLFFLVQQQVHAAVITFSGLKVSGNTIVNQQGQQVILRGIDRSGTEYMCIQGNGIFDGPSDAASVQAMKSWGINAVNIGLNEDCWLGINGVPSTMGGTAYQQAIINYVHLLESNQIYPTITLFWGAPGTQKATGLSVFPMPDNDHSNTFWQSVATTFKSDTEVILRLAEEPHPGGNSNSTAIWQCWKNGGSSCSESYTTVGMQTLVTTIRTAGATNIIAVPGIQYAATMDQFLTYKPTDSLHNLMGIVDVYPGGGSNDSSGCIGVSCYNSQYAPVIAQMPFMAGEFGESVNADVCSVSASNTFMDWMDQHNSGYLAWTWDTWGTSCGDLSLITNYAGTVHNPNGTNFKAHLLALGTSTTIAPTPSTSSGPTATPTKSTTSTINVMVTICPHGIGNCGDNVNPNGGNRAPQHAQQPVTLTFINSSGTSVSTAQGTVALDTTNESFQGIIPVTTLANGQYLVTVKMNGFLQKQVPGIVTVTQGQPVTFPSVFLITGDINNDNQVDILDYNLLISCYGSKQTSSFCTNPPSTTGSSGADINDNGVVDGVDYNLFLRELSVQRGV
jgi:hypothetical protein